MEHMHFGLLDGLRVFSYVIIFGFFWRIASAHWHSNAVGQAMSVIY